MNSLRIRLILLLVSGFVLAWSAAAWFTHIEARDEVDKLFDAQLAQSAQVLLATTRHDLHERIEHDDEDENGKTQISHEYEQKLAFQIWSGEKLLMRSVAAPDKPFSDREQGYSEIVLGGQAWRVFTRWDKHNEFMIQVAESFAPREALARHIALKMLIPSLIALPVLILLIWFAVGAGLQPLNKLKNQVTQRAADRLDPLETKNTPDEVMPLAQALNDLFARLQQAFDSERQFTADAAHELRTPLAALKTQAQVAMRASSDAERRSALENLLLGVDRATRLVAQLLTLARIDPETAQAGFEEIGLRRLVASVMADLSAFAHKKNIELVVEEGNNANVFGSQTQLELLVRNLLDNAIRYSPDGGRVSAVIRQNGGGVILEVTDTGPGIPASEREQVMQRFYRITGSGEEGSGLGLAIVRRIAELHHAQLILADNPAGQGLVVSVIFPVR